MWVVTHKRDQHGHVPYDAVAEEALAHGWVDSRPRKLDERRSQLLVTPRAPRSNWSRVNKQRIEALTAAGLMTPAGLAAVAVAKENGAWTALDDVENLVEPEELRAALDAEPAAHTHWDAFPRSAARDPRVDRDGEDRADPREARRRDGTPRRAGRPRKPVAPAQAPDLSAKLVWNRRGLRSTVPGRACRRPTRTATSPPHPDRGASR